MIFLNNKEKIEKIKFIDSKDFYVVADFDRTITQGNSDGTWAVFANLNELGEEYTKKRTDLYNYYRPIEINQNISLEQKSQEMTKWWNSHINLFYEFGLKEENITNSFKKCTLKYRDGAKEFLKAMKKLYVPVIIMSAGIGNIIEEFLNRENDYYDNIKVLSNFILFENGLIKGIDGKAIHTFNKNIIELDNVTKEKIKNRKNILLLGDGIGDLRMISEEDKERAVTVGFLEEKIEENLEYFNKNFDIVITNRGSFDELNNILKIY